MALADEISVKLGLSTTQFKQALKDAGADIKRFGSQGAAGTETLTGSLKGLGNTFKQLQVLFAAGGLRAALGYFEDLAEKAQKSKDIIDENIDSTRKWGEEWNEFKTTITNGAIQVLGVLAQIGRSAGDMIKSLIGGVKNIFGPGGFIEGFRAIADEIIRGNKAEKETRQNLLETLATIQKAKDTEKQRADEKRKQADAEKLALQNLKDQYEEAQKLKDSQNELADLDRKAALEKMTSEEKIVALGKERTRIEGEIANFTKFVADGGKLSLQGTQDLIVLKKQLIDITKDQADAEKEVNKAVEEQLQIRMGIAGIAGGAQLNNASEAEIRELIRRDKAREQLVASGANGFGIGQSLELARLQQEIQNALKELSTRNNLGGTLSLPGGIDIARRNYNGDPLGFDAFISQFQNKNPSETDQNLKGINNGINDINERLRVAGFGTGGGSGG